MFSTTDDTKISFNGINYQQLENGSSQSSELVYSVTQKTLPSHYRSIRLFPTCATNITGNQGDEITKRRLSTTAVYVILVTIFVVSLSVAAIIITIEVTKILNGPEDVLLPDAAQSTQVNKTNGITVMLQTHDPEVSYISARNEGLEQRTPCTSTCSAYSQPKFRSRCDEGYCVCEGDGYQRSTCLSSVGQCIIRKSSQGLDAAAYMGTTPQTVYQCMGEMDSARDIYVVSVYGNHFAKQTVVNISGTQRAPVTFVLASHYPVHWKLKQSGVEIQNIFLVSDLDANRSDVDWDKTAAGNTYLPEVTSLQLSVGYGDDKYNSNTTEMLRTLSAKFGSISNFVGASFADYFHIKLKT